MQEVFLAEYPFASGRLNPILYVYLLFSSVIALFSVAFAGVSLSVYLLTLAREHQATAESAQLSLKEQQRALEGQLTNVQTVVREIDPSAFSIAMWNWILPSLLFVLLFVLGVGAVLWLGLYLYERFSGFFRSNVGRSYSVFSASVSMVGMIFTILRFRSDLLQHDVAAYIFFSSLGCFLFFFSLVLLRSKLISLAIYLCLFALLAVFGWFTGGQVDAALTEYRAFLREMPIPYQILMSLGTALPIGLVFLGLWLWPSQHGLAGEPNRP